MTEEPTERSFERRVREFVAASRAGDAGRARGRADREPGRRRTLLAHVRSIVVRAIAKLRALHARTARDPR